MSLFKYTWAYHDETGVNGWISKLHPNFDPSSPDLIVHDCFEHLPRGQKHGGAIDELMAIGARAWLRLESGWFYSKGFWQKPEETFASEVVRIARDFDLRGLAQFPPISPIDPDTEWDAILTKAIPLIPQGLIDEDAISEDDEPYTADDPALLNCLYWMRRGALAIQKRFRDKNPGDVMWLAECMERDLKRYERGEEGDELHVRIHEKDMEYDIKYLSFLDRPQWWDQ
jgi:hypothetical protein